MSKAQAKIKRDDTVIVIAGKHKGKTGRVLKVLPDDRRVVVEKVNLVKRQVKPQGDRPGGTVQPPPTTPNPDQLISEAEAAARARQFGKALRLCQDALQLRPGDSEAAKVCVIASCGTKQAAAARRYLEKVKSETGVANLKQICMSENIDLR